MSGQPSGQPSAAQVAAACAAWTWYPDDAETADLGGSLLVRWPRYLSAVPTLLGVASGAVVPDLLEVALDRAAGWGAEQLQVWVRLDAPAGLEPALLDRGGRRQETVDVLALGLTGARPGLAVPPEVDVRWQRDEATVRDASAVAVEAFEEGELPDEQTVARLARAAAADLDAGRGGTVVGYLDGRPVATGGLSLVDGVARLWGGAVVPAARGRGAYRAVLAARLAHAQERGAKLALVKGRVETSGPTLRRAGFVGHGQERAYLLEVTAPASR